MDGGRGEGGWRRRCSPQPPRPLMMDREKKKEKGTKKKNFPHCPRNPPLLPSQPGQLIALLPPPSPKPARSHPPTDLQITRTPLGGFFVKCLWKSLEEVECA
ncbi:unnamed protein product [Gadus morhua 'NCC']